MFLVRDMKRAVGAFHQPGVNLNLISSHWGVSVAISHLPINRLLIIVKIYGKLPVCLTPQRQCQRVFGSIKKKITELDHRRIGYVCDKLQRVHFRGIDHDPLSQMDHQRWYVQIESVAHPVL